MIDAPQVLSLALGRMAPPTWQVLPAKRSHFITNIVGCIIGIVLAAAGLFYLYLNPNFIIGLRGGTDVDSLFNFWRVADFVVGGLIVFGLAWTMVDAFGELGGIAYQAFVLMPEGFVMQKGTTAQTVTTVNYAGVSGIRRLVNNGTYTLVFSSATDKSVLRLRLDARFGAPKQIAAHISDAYSRFLASRMPSAQYVPPAGIQ